MKQLFKPVDCILVAFLSHHIPSYLLKLHGQDFFWDSFNFIFYAIVPLLSILGILIFWCQNYISLTASKILKQNNNLISDNFLKSSVTPLPSIFPPDVPRPVNCTAVLVLQVRNPTAFPLSFYVIQLLYQF